MNLLAGAPGLDAVQAAAPARKRMVALVVTYDRQDHLQRTVDRLLAEDLDAILVVDNASTDSTADLLHAIADPRLHVLRLAQNTGGAGGFEAGLREVQRRFDPDWCVLLDDDARPAPGAMQVFLSRAAGVLADGFEAIAAGVYYPDGRICDMNRPSRNPFWHLPDFLRTLFGGGRAGFHLMDVDYSSDQPVPIDAASFVGFFLSRKGLARAGFPDGDLFIYGDDVIYTLQMTQKGGRIGFLPVIHFEHDCATYHPGGGDIYRPLWKVYYNYRNSLLAYRVATGPVLFWPILALAALKWRLRARHAGVDRAVYMRLYRMAISDAVRHRLTRSFAEITAIASGRS